MAGFKPTRIGGRSPTTCPVGAVGAFQRNGGAIRAPAPHPAWQQNHEKHSGGARGGQTAPPRKHQSM